MSLTEISRRRQLIILRALYLRGITLVGGHLIMERVAIECHARAYRIPVVTAFLSAILARCAKYEPTLGGLLEPSSFDVAWIDDVVILALAKRLVLLFRLRSLQIPSQLRAPPWEIAAANWNEAMDLAFLHHVVRHGFSSLALFIAKVADRMKPEIAPHFRALAKIELMTSRPRCVSVPPFFQHMVSVDEQERRITVLIQEMKIVREPETYETVHALESGGKRLGFKCIISKEGGFVIRGIEIAQLSVAEKSLGAVMQRFAKRLADYRKLHPDGPVLPVCSPAEFFGLVMTSDHST
jgi:hypothetical protein